MCGRFTQTSPVEALIARFHADPPAEQVLPRYNIAPGQPVLAVVHRPGRERPVLAHLRWGLIPSWAKDPKMGYRMINARSESLAVKPAFRNLIRRRRCLVVADGFYEWQATPSGKLPMRFVLASREPFAFAGLWDLWKPPGDEPPLATCTIITVPANEVVGRVHDRMPAILRPEDEARWLDPEDGEWGPLSAVLRPYEAGAMEAYPVRRLVNSPANDGPECIEPGP